MAFEKLRTIMIGRSLSRRERLRKISEAIPTRRKTRIEGGIAIGVLSRPFFLSIRGNFSVVDDEHFMFATGASEAGRPNRAPVTGGR